MLDISDTSRFELPPGALVGTLDLEGASGNRSSLLMQVLDRIKKSHAAQVEWARQFDTLYEEAVHGDYSAPFLVRWAAALIEKERSASERIYPLLEEIQRLLAALEKRPDPEITALCVATFSVTLNWMAPYQKLSSRLLDLASARQSGPTKILQAKPIGYDIDHGALTDKIIARFPNILKALAE